jgi:hypothetical protein
VDIFNGLLALLGTTHFDPVTNPHPYPLIRAGGLFIFIMGLGIAIGTVREWLILPMIGVSFAIGFFTLSQVQPALLSDMGTLNDLQFNMIIVANIAQGLAIGLWCAFLLPKEGPTRRFILGILVIVGLHFVFFFPSMGWIMLLVALFCTGWALYTLRQEKVSISRAYLVDGLIKMLLGLGMIVFYPV